jgi:hypothetical protein
MCCKDRAGGWALVLQGWAPATACRGGLRGRKDVAVQRRRQAVLCLGPPSAHRRQNSRHRYGRDVHLLPQVQHRPGAAEGDLQIYGYGSTRLLGERGPPGGARLGLGRQHADRVPLLHRLQRARHLQALV